MIIPRYNLQGLDTRKYTGIQLHPVRKVEEALRALFG
jgi:DNA repair protein RadA/Sms